MGFDELSGYGNPFIWQTTDGSNTVDGSNAVSSMEAKVREVGDNN